MRFLVVHVGMDGVGPQGADLPVCGGVTLCADTREVAAAIDAIVQHKDQENGLDDWDDWAVFEVVGGKAVRRSVLFREPYNVEGTFLDASSPLRPRWADVEIVA